MNDRNLTLWHPLTLVLIGLMSGLCLLPTPCHAGANETPGAGGKPHAFSSFHANYWEFGGKDRSLFDKYVVNDQHYRDKGFNVDGLNDTNSEGAGVFSYSLFLGGSDADVLLVTSHGSSAPGTIVEQYVKTPAGKTARDNSYSAWSLLFPGMLSKVATSNGYGIEVNAAFYDQHLRTPEAFLWLATCYSSKLGPSLSAGARCWVGHDAAVANATANYNQEIVLRRMDGQEGQQKRPLEAAIAGVNGGGPASANMVAGGKLNTVLSPSVIDWWPQGVVCTATPGYVEFDCTMEKNAPPDIVVEATGDGFLINHAWFSDDMITFDVIPTDPQPFIVYWVREFNALSKANWARLDGNLNPPQNAKGPNRDDFVWATSCPPRPSTPATTPPSVPTTPARPGRSTPVGTPISNGSGAPQSGTAGFSDGLGWTGFPIVDILMAIDEMLWLFWNVTVPLSAVPGTVNPWTLDVEIGGQHMITNGEILVDSWLDVRLDGPPPLAPETPCNIELQLLNETDVTVTTTTMDILGNGAVWASWTGSLTTAPGEGERIIFTVTPPPELPPNAPVVLELDATTEGVMLRYPLVQVDLGLGLSVESITPVELVPNGPVAAIDLWVLNESTDPVDFSLSAVDTRGYGVSVTAPSGIPLGGQEPVHLSLGLPPDPALIGNAGEILLHFDGMAAQLGRTQTISIPYVVESGLGLGTPDAPEQSELPLRWSIYTGSDQMETFVVPVSLRNRTASPMEGDLTLTLPGLTVVPSTVPIDLLPGEMSDVLLDVELPVDTPPQWIHGSLEVITLGGIGDRAEPVELEITAPVVVNFLERGTSAVAGEAVTVRAAIENRRDDVAMSGTFEWEDTKKWIPSDLPLPWWLDPAAKDTLDVTFVPPATAIADSDTVTISLFMSYRSGTPALELRSVEVEVLPTPGMSGPPTVGLARGRIVGCYPNPFNPRTEIVLELPRREWITLVAHDAAGRRVARIWSGQAGPGRHEVTWEARADDGSRLASGIYFVRMISGDGSSSEKVVLLK